jgi:hypothetical protein
MYNDGFLIKYSAIIHYSLDMPFMAYLLILHYFCKAKIMADVAQLVEP